RQAALLAPPTHLPQQVSSQAGVTSTNRLTHAHLRSLSTPDAFRRHQHGARRPETCQHPAHPSPLSVYRG
ncbi:hypothetical protein Q604_UNBC02759G0001, partial [human gut metagenome]